MLYLKFKKSKKFVVSLLVILTAIIVGCASNVAVNQEESGVEESQSVMAQPEQSEQLVEEDIGNTVAQYKRITGIEIVEDEGTVSVVVQGDGQLAYTSRMQSLPPALVLYFPETGLDTTDTELTVDSDIIDMVKASELIENGPSKIEIVLKKDVLNKITSKGDSIKIAFSKTGAGFAEQEEEPAEIIALDDAETEIAVEEPAIDEMPEASIELSEEAPVEAPPVDIESLPAATQFERVDAEPFDNSVRINIITDGVIKDYDAFTLPAAGNIPARIVFDVPNLKSPYTKQQVVSVDSEIVKRVRHFAYPNKVRFVVDTEEKYFSQYSPAPAVNGLVINVGAVVKEPKTDFAAVTDVPDEAVEEMGALEDEQPVESVEMPEELPVMTDNLNIEPGPDVLTGVEEEQQAEVVTYKGPALVNRTDFTSEEGGRSSIIIGTTRPVKYSLEKVKDNELQLNLFDANILKYRQRPIITTRFESAVDRITPVQTAAMKKNSQIVIELRENVPYNVEQSENVITINFEASSIKPRPFEDAKLPPWKDVLERPAVEVQPEPEKISETAVAPEPDEDLLKSAEAELAMPEGVSAEAEVSEFEKEKMAPASEYEDEEVDNLGEGASLSAQFDDERSLKLRKKKYTGEKIALDFYQTDIKNVLRIIRDVSGKNFAIDKDVSGKVTLTLVKPIPWDQVLDLILKMNQLGSVIEGDIIRITTIATLKQEEDLMRAKLEAEQQRKAVVIALKPLVTEYIPISYADAAGDVVPHLQKILTPDRGNVTVDARNNQIIFTDTEENVRKAREIVRSIDKVTPQVVIEARIVEVTEQFSRDIGTTWNIDQTRTGSSTTSGFGIAMNHPASSSTGSFDVNFSRITGNPLTLYARLNAAEVQGEGKIVSAPKIVTLDNVPASILQGVEYPYQKDDGNGNTTTEFKAIDLKLTVTPHVTPDNRIAMDLNIIKKDIGQLTSDGPSIDSNEANTKLLVNDGDTIVIGGIIKHTSNATETRWPWLGKIPFVGWLFKSKAVSTTDRELLIFITPRIVHLEKHTS